MRRYKRKRITERCRKKLICSLFGLLVLVLGSCCYEIYLADRSLSDVCTDEDKCDRKIVTGEKQALHHEKITGVDNYITTISRNIPLESISSDKSSPQSLLETEKKSSDLEGATTENIISTEAPRSTIGREIDQTGDNQMSTIDEDDLTTDKESGRINENQPTIVTDDKHTYRQTYFVDSPTKIIPTLKLPKILWWDFYSYGSGKDVEITCKQGVQCHAISNRSYISHPDTKAILHYGTHINFLDLPKERNPNMIWGLIHEESMKNADYLFNHEEMLSLFNYTSTFRRESDYPVTTNFLENLDDLQSKQFLVPVEEKNRLKEKEGLAPIFYIHSDCGVPSNRDKYVELLQKYIPVDSYGRCNNNKKLPNHLTFEKSMQPMLEKEFYQLAAKYKFTLAMENAVCNDYITEKIWRPLQLGSVPIIFGSPKVKDFLPSSKSAIVINDFNITDLAALVHYLDKNDTAYNEYLQYKEPGGITNGYLVNVMKARDWDKTGRRRVGFYSFFSGFECFICEQIHKHETARKNGHSFTKVATLDHYGCPEPRMFNEDGQYIILDKRFSYYWHEGKYKAKAFRHFYDNHLNFTMKQIDEMIATYRKQSEGNT